MSNATEIEVVPLGLGFEMPEAVWCLQAPCGLFLGGPVTSEPGYFVCAWLTEEDAWCATTVSAKMADTVPVKCTLERLRNMVRVGYSWFGRLFRRPKFRHPVDGVVLFTWDGKEIGRRYFR